MWEGSANAGKTEGGGERGEKEARVGCVCATNPPTLRVRASQRDKFPGRAFPPTPDASFSRKTRSCLPPSEPVPLVQLCRESARRLPASTRPSAKHPPPLFRGEEEPKEIEKERSRERETTHVGIGDVDVDDPIGRPGDERRRPGEVLARRGRVCMRVSAGARPGKTTPLQPLLTSERTSGAALLVIVVVGRLRRLLLPLLLLGAAAAARSRPARLKASAAGRATSSASSSSDEA